MFETERLVVRRIGPADAEAMHAVYGDRDAMRWVGEGEPLDLAQCYEWIDVTARNYERRGYGMSALVLKESGEVIGFCGLVHPGGQREAEIKYALKREAWGQGLATEAVRGMLAWGARELGLAEIIATTAPANAASHRVLQKAGMQDLRMRPNADGSVTRMFVWRAGGGNKPPADSANC